MGIPFFTITYTGSNIAPCTVEFTDMYRTPEERIWRFDFGNGHIFEWDNSDQTIVREVYQNPGTYKVMAIAIDRKTESDPISVVIAGSPVPDPVDNSWLAYLRGLWSWLKHLFGG